MDFDFIRASGSRLRYTTSINITYLITFGKKEGILLFEHLDLFQNNVPHRAHFKN